jgi:hypothetical protein
VKREQLAWSLVGLFNLLAVIILVIGFARLDGYAIGFTWQLILAITLAVLVIAFVLLWLIVR